MVLFESEEDVTVCFITSQQKRISEFDLVIDPSDINGLKKKSIARLNKMATIDKNLILGRLGSLEVHQIEYLDQQLITLFRLNIK